MNIKENLKDFYNKEASKYYYTRNKHWSDGQIILDEIKKLDKKNISILEFWCWWGRLIKFLNSNLKNTKINYIGVDISKKLLELAKKDNPTNEFICDDITNYINKIKQESIDIIIWVASFQHIPTHKERLYLLKSFYKSLKYNWVIIMTNRSISNWFIKKHFKVILKSLTKTLYTIWLHNYRDLEIPRQGKNKSYKRYYHMFWKKELITLGKTSWFKIEKLTYIDKNWLEVKSYRESNNIFFVWKKGI